MNKIFKVVLNRTTGKLVVASELTKSHGKAASSTDDRVGVSSLAGKLQYQAKVALMLGLLGMSSVATALTEGTTAESAIAIGTGSTTSKKSVAIGVNAKAGGTGKEQSVALGESAQANGAQSISIGGDTRAEGYASVSIGGDDANTTPYQDLRYNDATGAVENRGTQSQYQRTTASGGASIAIGVKSQATANGTVATGVLATATGVESTALGAMSAAKGERAIAVGAGSTASGTKALAAGDGSRATHEKAIAVGSGSTASGTQAFAAGDGAVSSNTKTIALGSGSTASGAQAFAAGDGAVSSNTKTIALGSGSTASGLNAFAAGDSSQATGSKTIALGSGATASGNDSFAIGVGAQSVNANSLAIGTAAKASGNSGFAIGNKAGTSANDSVAMGTLSRASGIGAYASGIAARAVGAESVAIGWMTSTGTGANEYDNTDATAHVATVAGKTGNFSVAIGSNLAVTGTKSIGIGYAGNGTANNSSKKGEADVSGDNSIALGHSNKVASNNTVVIGNSIKIAAGINNATALGDATSVTQANGVALGATSVASRGVLTVSGYDMTTGTNSTTNDSTWRATTAAVSVGNGTTATRQITSVAAGTEDTDAVNVAQLKKAKVEVVAGNNVTVTKDTTAGYTKYTISTQAAKTEVEGTNGVEVTSSDITGGKKFTVKLSDANQAKLDAIDADALNAAKDKVNQGLIFAGNVGTPTTKQLGNTVNIVGAHTGTDVSAKNIRTEVLADGNVQIQMTEKPEFKEVTAGEGNTKTVIGKDGVKVTKADGTPGPSLTANGLDNAGNKITNVAKGENDTDAVNMAQLKKLENTLGLAKDENGNLTSLAKQLRDETGAAVESGDMRTLVYNTADRVNAGILYGGDKNDLKTLTANPADTSNKQQLGSQFSVLSATDTLAKDGSSNGFVGKNLVTKYTRNADGSGNVQIGMTEKPEFKEVTVVDPANQNQSTTLTPTGTKVKDGNNEATYGANGIGLKGDNGTTTLGRDAEGNLTVDKDGTGGKDPVALATKDDIDAVKGSANDLKDKLGLPANDVTGALEPLDIPKVEGSGKDAAPTTLYDAVKDAATAINKGISLKGNNYSDATSDATQINKKLGEVFEVVGGLDINADASDKNIRTEVKDGKLHILMSEKPEFKEVAVEDKIKVGTDGNGVSITPDGTTTTKTVDGKTTTSTLGADGTSITGPDGKSAEYKLDGSKVNDGKGNETSVKADGMTVKSTDPNDKSEATYGKDGLTVKGNDGNDAIALTSKTDPNSGETTNTLALKGKDGKDAVSISSGADGKAPTMEFAKDGENGTGTITGLKDVERNQDGTAKDRTAAANAGYVDDRLAEVNAGKPFEYFDNNGNKVVRGQDGKFYTEDELKGKTYDPVAKVYKDANSNAVSPTLTADKVTIKAMPNDSAMALGNVKSNIGPNNGEQPITAENAKTAVAGADGKSGLLTKTGPELNNAATVGDLQALAQAGLDFTGNNTATTVHRPLGTKLVVEGETSKTAAVTKTDFGATAKDNIHVEAVADGDTNKLVVSLAENLKDINKVDFKPTKVTNPDGTETYAKSSISSAGNTYTEVNQDGTDKPNAKTSEYGLNGAKVTEKDPTTGETKETTMGADGTHATVTDANNKPIKSADYTADGSTVKAIDPATGKPTAESKYGADGLSTKALDPATGEVKGETTVSPTGVNLYGKDGKDGADGKDGEPGKPVASLTNTVGKDGKNNPSLDFAKEGEGDDAKGTGSVTGLKDLERNPDGTAKDKTAATSAGYVDERLAEADAGKPFEYFETDPATGEVKTETVNGKEVPVKLVRGQDGKFYKPEVLEGKVYVEGKGYVNRADKDNPDAKPVDLTANEVNPQTVTIKAMPSDKDAAPIAMGNVGSGLKLDDSKEGNAKALEPAAAKEAIAGKDGKGGLLAQTGDALNNVATVKDLQALAQAGLDFSGNVGETHRPLGTKLAIEGKSGVTDAQYKADYSTDNIATKVTEEGKLEIAMKKEPEFNKLTVKTDTAPAVTFKTEKLDRDNTAYDINGDKIAGKDEVLTALNVGDKDGNPVKIKGVADGDITPDSTQAVNGRQVYALTNGNQVVQNNDGSTVTYAKDKDGSVITEVKRDKNGNPVLDADGKEIVQPKEYKLTTYNVEGQTEFVTNSVITAVHNMNEQGIKFFHTNDDKVSPIDQTGPNGIDSSASGAYATAVGYQATASGTNALAMGKGATATGENSIAIGTGNQVAASKSGAFGDPNIIMGTTSENDAVSGSYAIGNDNVINSSNTFVLGNDVNNKLDADGNVTGTAVGSTVENSVYLGNKTTATAGDGSATGSLKNRKQDGTEGETTTAGSTGTVSTATVGSMTYGGFAGAKADGVVSVGAAGNERRIQNVAAGEISATSTDAINGSQLYHVAKGLDALDGKVNRMNRKLRSGIAAATAMSNIPQVTIPGKTAVGAGVGSYDGEGALAVGYSRMSDNGRVILKVTAGASTQGKYNVGAGVAYQW